MAQAISTEQGLAFFNAAKQLDVLKTPRAYDGFSHTPIPPSQLCPHCKNNLRLRYPFNKKGIIPA